MRNNNRDDWGEGVSKSFIFGCLTATILIGLVAIDGYMKNKRCSAVYVKSTVEWRACIDGTAKNDAK